MRIIQVVHNLEGTDGVFLFGLVDVVFLFIVLYGNWTQLIPGHDERTLTDFLAVAAACLLAGRARQGMLGAKFS